MSTPLVFIEVQDGRPTAGSLALLAVARRLAGSAAAVVGGPGAGAIAPTLGTWGADEAWWSDDPALGSDLGGPHVDALAGLVRDAGVRTILFENSILATDIAAGLSARLDAGVNWDLQGLEEREGSLVGRRLGLDDTLGVDVGWIGDVRLAVFRVGAAEPVEQSVECRTLAFRPVIGTTSIAVTVVERSVARSVAMAQLASADTIVAVGRGIRDQEGLALIEDLADALDGAVAVSLPIVDRGWYPTAHQVGQTGQTVRPRLYLACGISGALAHRVGMEKSGLIVAINTDPAAPIFGICDAGVVGDLHEIVPALTRLVREAHGES